MPSSEEQERPPEKLYYIYVVKWAGSNQPKGWLLSLTTLVEDRFTNASTRSITWNYGKSVEYNVLKSSMVMYIADYDERCCDT
jgi:hypothetical protein